MGANCSCGGALTGYSLGIFFIVVVAVIWAGASVLTQFVYNNLDFQSPFLVTYISTGLFSLYLPLWRLWVWLQWVEDPPFRRTRQERPTENGAKQQFYQFHNPLTPETPLADASFENNSGVSIVNDSARLLERTAGAICDILSSDQGTPGYNNVPADDLTPDDNTMNDVALENISGRHNSHEEVIVVALKVAPLWFMANCGYNYSLLLTSVGSSTIISNLSGSFTLLFAYMVGIEQITGGKLLALFISLCGVALIAVQDESDDSPQTLIGDIVALGAAACYGLYTTTIRVQIPEEEGEGSVSMQLLFGYIGAITTVGLSPCLFLVGVFHLGNLSELTGKVFGFLVLGSIFNNVISDYLWARSVVLTSPTIATVGLSITIPLAILSDFLFFGTLPTWFSVSGALLVIAGFVIISCEKWLRVVTATKCPCLASCVAVNTELCVDNTRTQQESNLMSSNSTECEFES